MRIIDCQSPWQSQHHVFGRILSCKFDCEQHSTPCKVLNWAFPLVTAKYDLGKTTKPLSRSGRSNPSLSCLSLSSHQVWSRIVTFFTLAVPVKAFLVTLSVSPLPLIISPHDDPCGTSFRRRPSLYCIEPPDPSSRRSPPLPPSPASLLSRTIHSWREINEKFVLIALVYLRARSLAVTGSQQFLMLVQNHYFIVMIMSTKI